MSEIEAKHNDDKLQQPVQHANTSEEDERDTVSSSLSPAINSLCCLHLGLIRVYRVLGLTTFRTHSKMLPIRRVLFTLSRKTQRTSPCPS